MSIFSINRLRRRIYARRFVRDEDGGVIVENILWIPFMLIFMIAILDLAMIFMNYALAQRMVDQANRNLAVGEFENCTEMVDWLQPELRKFIPRAVAGCDRSGAWAQAFVMMRTGDIDLSGATGLLGGMTISVGGIQKFETAPKAEPDGADADGVPIDRDFVQKYFESGETDYDAYVAKYN